LTQHLHPLRLKTSDEEDIELVAAAERIKETKSDAAALNNLKQDPELDVSALNSGDAREILKREINREGAFRLQSNLQTVVSPQVAVHGTVAPFLRLYGCPAWKYEGSGHHRYNVRTPICNLVELLKKYAEADASLSLNTTSLSTFAAWKILDYSFFYRVFS
jgi:hypothetical protein